MLFVNFDNISKGVRMKLAKLSLAAIVALSVSAFAEVENVKFSGDAKLYYGTDDSGNNDLFDKDGAYGQAAATIAVTADLADGVAGKLSVTGLSTLGLENNLVSATWAGYEGGVESQWWVSEAWLAKTFGNTTIKVGRQELDTPLAFTETWNIAKNTFDAAVLLNSDLPETTLVAAWVGRGNGANGGVVRGVVNGTDPFDTYVKEGAYAVAAITKLIPMTTAQVWYYNVVDVADAWWLQADVNLEDVSEGLTAGAQYGFIDVDGVSDDTSGFALKLGYKMDNLKLCAAYSSTDEDGPVRLANTATGLGDMSQSKLYTEAWWNYGYVSANDVDSYMLRAAYSMEDVADFMAQYTAADAGKKSMVEDMNEFTLTASKSFGNLNTTLAYIYTDADDQNDGDSYNTVQVYLNYNF
jgi:hypothetical protein